MDISILVIFLVFLPVILIQLGLQVYCLIDLHKREKVRFDNKMIWVLIIILGSLLGSILYLVLREDKNDDSHQNS